MCGLAAIFAYGKGSASVDRKELLRMREAMVSRGPDGSGLWISDNERVGLAHRRLSIIDLSKNGSQPMATPDGRYRIVLNGQIYNYPALRLELERKGYKFESSSDTEVLLHLYADKGQEMVHDLRGMYAFAIWDEGRRNLLLARDPFGIKPLYYADDGKTLRVASQVKALLSGGCIETAPEPAGHVGFFLWGHVPEPYTMFKQIRALPAGTTLLVNERGSLRQKHFSDISHEIAKAENVSGKNSNKASRLQFREALLDSIKHHLVSDVPVGIFLSSGLDSTALIALASELFPNGICSVTLGFNEFRGTPKDETPYAELIAQRYGAKHQTKWISRAEFQTDLDPLLAAMDQPSFDGVNTYFVSKVAAETGLKVALSGLGGDEILAGYPGFRQIPLMAKTIGPLRYLPFVGKAFRWVSSPLIKQFTSPKYAGLLEYGGSFGGAYLLRRGLFMPWELPQVLDGEMVREGWSELQPLLLLEETVQGINSDRLKVSAMEMTSYMRNQLLMTSDWAGMAHSLEIRVPFVDVQLLRNLLPLLTTKTPPSKRSMAIIPKKSLPKEVLDRQKTGFLVPIHEWLDEKHKDASMARGLRGWARKVYENWRP